MTDHTPDEIRRRYKLLPKPQREQVSQFIDQQADSVASSDRQGDLTHRVTGRLVFDDGPNAVEPKPLHNVTVELWDRDLGHDDYLGRSVTDRDGCFEIWYDPRDAGFADVPDMQIRVYDHDHVFSSDGEIEQQAKMVFLFDGDNNVSDELYEFGRVSVPYWTYDPHKPIPRIHVVKHGSPPQSFARGRAVMLVKYVAHVEVQHQLHHAENKINHHLPSLGQIQSAYPENLTMRLEQKQAGYSRGDEYFGDRILNGMSASILDRDPRDMNRFWLHHHWTSYAQDDIYAMPNVDVWFELQKKKLMPVEIALQFRRRGHTEADGPLLDPVRFTPASGQKWLQAKRVARVSAALHAELDAHLVQTHLNTEQYAMAAYRNLRQSPLRLLLAPHLKEVILINRDADDRLLGDHGYIAQATALQSDAIIDRVVQSLGTLDWKNWQPRKILCDQHLYARSAHLYWDLLTEYVDIFFSENIDQIRQHWYEVHRFSNDLVEHSVDFYLCPFLQGHRDKDTGSLGEWYEQNERMDLSIPREVVDGKEKAIQRITRSDNCDAESLENMKQVCRYAIFHATFMHTWTNSRQHDDGGELRYNGIGLRYGDHGILSGEDDESIAPPPKLATDQLWYSWMLSNSNYGFITRNEDRDIHSRLIRMLQEKREAFDEVDFDINKLQSRVNI